MTDNRLLFRGYAEAADLEEAGEVCEGILVTVDGCGRVVRSHVQRYWKLPEQFEVFFVCEADGAAAPVFERMLTLLGTGWDVHRFKTSGPWAVWNRGAETRFCRPEVTWANLECIRE